jgi:hypothetical protein
LTRRRENEKEKKNIKNKKERKEIKDIKGNRKCDMTDIPPANPG